MKVLISADMEGVSGVVDWTHVSSGHVEYARFRQLMTEDVNAAVRGAFNGGADEVLIADAHGSKTNILIEKLNERAKLNSGSTSPLAMIQGIDSGIDAAFFVGYHARNGAENAILSHTVSGSRVANVWINDRLAGEFGMNAAVCGFFNVPVLLVSSDAAGCREAEEWVPGIHKVVVKSSSGRYSAECLPPRQAQKLIEEAAFKAASRFKNGEKTPLVKFEAPFKVRLEYMNEAMADNASGMPGVTRLDGRTIEMISPDAPTAYRTFRSAVALGNS